jgi:hypothetical protein
MPEILQYSSFLFWTSVEEDVNAMQHVGIEKPRPTSAFPEMGDMSPPPPGGREASKHFVFEHLEYRQFP